MGKVLMRSVDTRCGIRFAALDNGFGVFKQYFESCRVLFVMLCRGGWKNSSVGREH
jgi:hypothetical protein